MSCENCTCKQKVSEKKRYHISSNKNIYVAESFDTIDEALKKSAELINAGFGRVSLYDTSIEEDETW